LWRISRGPRMPSIPLFEVAIVAGSRPPPTAGRTRPPTLSTRRCPFFRVRRVVLMNHSGLMRGVDLVALATTVALALIDPPTADAETVSQSLYVTTGSVTATVLSSHPLHRRQFHHGRPGLGRRCAGGCNDRSLGGVLRQGGWHRLGLRARRKRGLVHRRLVCRGGGRAAEQPGAPPVGELADPSWNPNANGTVFALA
jgi:hypothetical protein